MTDKKEQHISAMASPAVGEAGETGQWRTERPVVDNEKCVSSKNGKLMCMTCWLYCPEAVIDKSSPVKIDLKYCKGCGICARECPKSAIKMVPEEESE